MFEKKETQLSIYLFTDVLIGFSKVITDGLSTFCVGSFLRI